jgi:hypothetical protein
MLLPPFVGAINHRFKIDKLDAAGDRSAISKRRSECPNRAPFQIHPVNVLEAELFPLPPASHFDHGSGLTA